MLDYTLELHTVNLETFVLNFCVENLTTPYHVRFNFHKINFVAILTMKYSYNKYSTLMEIPTLLTMSHAIVTIPLLLK